MPSAIVRLIEGVGADRLGVAFREGYAAALRSALSGSKEDPRAPSTHFALAGVLSLGRQVIDACDFAGVPDEERARWLRDQPLLDVAGKVRALRFASACRALQVGYEESSS